MAKTFQPTKAVVRPGAVLGSQGGASNPSAGYLNPNSSIVGLAVANKGSTPSAAKYGASGRKVFDDQLLDGKK